MGKPAQSPSRLPDGKLSWGSRSASDRLGQAERPLLDNPDRGDPRHLSDPALLPEYRPDLCCRFRGSGGRLLHLASTGWLV